MGLAFLTRDIYLSLFVGAFSGALLLHGGNPWTVFHDLLIGRLIPALTDRWNISVLVFTLLMGGLVEVLNRHGGMAALSARVMGHSRSPRRAGLGAYFMGWLVFLLASIISFSTGTSWGTMAIVMPLAFPLAVKLTAFQVGLDASPVLVATVGAVLAGAVFGDHCSPISDTTIVSAFSSDCEVMAHVRTQLPYALTAAFLATVLGYLPAGFGVSPFFLLAIRALACWLLVRHRGQRLEAPAPE